MANPRVEPQAFAANMRCLAYHGPLLYESKILKVHDPKTGESPPADEELPEEMRDKIAYLIHYKGWKSTWDEWLPQERVLRWTEESLRMQKELKQAALQDMKKKKAGLSPTQDAKDSPAPAVHKRREPAKDDALGQRGPKKRRRDQDYDKEEEYFKRPEIHIAIPTALKNQLVDDWERVTKNQQLIPLPRTPTVQVVLDRYMATVAKKRSGSAEADIFDEVLAGIKIYFNRSLGKILLYRFERQQYLDIKKTHPDDEPCDVYGAEHLLRLFVSLPGLIGQTSMDQQSVGVLQKHVEEFLRFLAKNREEFFVESYVNASPSYEAASRGL
ncbi:MRG-domain-containing protein [Dipodascopsis tothii]|uniref:MRG-domain-containing protein n=1 Tax=Dipodascopsis tothii TaxID=44089 RepID=UPI0034CE3D08